jgi:hypothetical protein
MPWTLVDYKHWLATSLLAHRGAYANDSFDPSISVVDSSRSD